MSNYGSVRYRIATLLSWFLSRASLAVLIAGLGCDPDSGSTPPPGPDGGDAPAAEVAPPGPDGGDAPAAEVAPPGPDGGDAPAAEVAACGKNLGAPVAAAAALCQGRADCSVTSGQPDHGGCPNTCSCLCFQGACYPNTCTLIACTADPVYR